MGKAGVRRSKVVLAAVTVLVIGLALRVPIISVSPILVQLRDFYELGSAAAGLLTSLPVLCFGALALLAPRLVERFGMERTMSAMLLVIIVGMLIRSVAGVAGLFAGTIVLGAAIARVRLRPTRTLPCSASTTTIALGARCLRCT